MPLATIRPQIKALIESVAGVGVVHDYERYSADPATVLAFFQTVEGQPLKGWFFKLARRDEFTKSNKRSLLVYTFDVSALYSEADAAATEKTFTDLIMAVCDKFRLLANVTLAGTCERTDTEAGPLAGRTGLQVDSIEYLRLSGTLVHFARMKLAAQEFITR